MNEETLTIGQHLWEAGRDSEGKGREVTQFPRDWITRIQTKDKKGEGERGGEF